jgi:hypothetical protein
MRAHGYNKKKNALALKGRKQKNAVFQSPSSENHRLWRWFSEDNKM